MFFYKQSVFSFFSSEKRKRGTMCKGKASGVVSSTTGCACVVFCVAICRVEDSQAGHESVFVLCLHKKRTQCCAHLKFMLE